AVGSSVLPEGVSLMSADTDAIAAFRAAGGGSLELPAAEGSTLTLELEPYALLAPGASITTTDALGRHDVRPDVSLYRGRIAGEAGSWAVVALGEAGVFGALQHDGQRYNLAPSQTLPARASAAAGLPMHVLAPESARADGGGGFACGIDGSNEDALSVPLNLPPPNLAAPKRTAGTAQVGATRTVWKIAIDCDYEVYHLKFADNLAAATSYVLTVAGTVNLIYERDLEATLSIPYLNLWTTVSDPYTATTTAQQLTQLQGYWATNNAAVQRSAVFLMSGRPLGGGIALIGSLCNTPSAYALAAMDFTYTYPTATSTWDVDVMAHELGHVFGSYHTQSCNWATQGYIPAATTLDSCWTPEGGCLTYSNHLPPDKGTIMSYCHVQFGVANGIRLDFHPICVQRMRSVMSVAACSTQATVQPPRNVAIAPLGNSVRLTWTAGGSANVLGYEVARSPLPLDTQPGSVGFTAALQFDDAGFGSYWYRVRTIRAADTSAWSAEVKGTSSCNAIANAGFTVDPDPVAAVPLDINGDGREDLVVARKSGSLLATLPGLGTGATGNGSFAAPTSFPTGSQPACIATSDMTGDGIADLVVGAQGDNSLRMHRGNAIAGVPDGTFLGPAGGGVLPGAPVSLTVADTDEDGIEDVLVCADGTVARIRGLGTAGLGNGTFGTVQSTPVSMLTADLVLHDFNSDGVLDLAVSGSTGLALLAGSGNAGKGDGTFLLPVFYAAGVNPGRMAVTDLDQDGADDLLVCDRGDTLVRVFRGLRTNNVANGTFAAGVPYGAGSNPSSIAIVDWDHDGLADVVIGNDTAPGTVNVLIGRGDGTLAKRFFVPTGGNNVVALVATDYDENGVLDVLALHKSSGTAVRVTPLCASALTPSLTLSTPNGAEQWSAQDERVVRWNKSGGILSVDVQLSLDSGAHWRTIARELTGTSWTWTVGAATTTHARLRVVAHGMTQVSDASNADFVVLPFNTLDVADGPPRLSLLGAWPNPARQELTVSFSLPAGARGTLDMVDLTGRRVASRDLSGLAGGTHQVRLLEHASLPPGVYLVRLRTGADLRLAKVSVVR
ncbi:MAG: FG-GAP-like repeat-containing protein, partial [Candidatus Eisenbacteria bacterium]